jgi:hypothetical protein
MQIEVQLTVLKAPATTFPGKFETPPIPNQHLVVLILLASVLVPNLPLVGRCRRAHIDLPFGDQGQLLVRFALLGEGLL